MRFFLPLFAVLIFLSGCKPEQILINVYSTDVSTVLDGEIVEIPLTAKLALIGNDEDNTLKQVVELTKKFVHPETRFTRSKTEYSEVLVVETLIPMGNQIQLEKFFAENTSLAYIEVKESPGDDYFEVTFLGSSSIENFNRAIKGLNPILGFELPAASTSFRVISDSRKNVLVEADAVFIAEKPHLYFQTALKRRDEISFVYKGGADSIWSGVPPVFYIKP